MTLAAVRVTGVVVERVGVVAAVVVAEGRAEAAERAERVTETGSVRAPVPTRHRSNRRLHPIRRRRRWPAARR